VTITGTSGKQTASIAVPVNIYAPTFTLSGAGGVVVGRGTSSTTYVFVYPQYGFAGNVQFSATGLPAGVTASFSPNPTSSSTTLTLTASSTATLGDYKFTVTGTSGSQKASIISTVGVYVPIFSIYGPNSMSIGQGTAISTTISISPQYGFAGSVQFAISGLPSGVTASFSSNPATIGTTLTLTASGTAPLGQYTLTVTGTSGSQSASTTIALGVYVPTFTLAAYSGGSIGQGGTSTTTLWVYPQYGFTGNVQLSVSGLPSGVTASFSPNPTNSTSTLTLTASSTAAVGQYTIKVTGTSGTQTVSTTFSLGVYVPTFTLYDYSPVYLSAGGTGVSYVYITDEYGFNGNVQLSVSGLPSGVTASFSPNPTGTSSTLTLTAGSSAASGQYTIIINGVSGSQSSSTTLGVIVN